MKKLAIILSIGIIITGFYSCKFFETNDNDVEVHFKDIISTTIYDYIVEHEDQYSDFLALLKVAKLDKTLSAYNPESDEGGYTLFLPDNAAIDSFLANNGTYSTLDQLLQDTAYVRKFCRYHVVNDKIDANDFPFGALSSFNLTEDYLTVSFIVQEDTSYYKINNQAPVSQTNIEMANGFIHLISIALTPIVVTTYGWLEKNSAYSIFKDAVDATGLKNLLNVNTKENPNVLKSTLFLEADSIFHKQGIKNLADLEALISPGNTDYTNPLNPLYNFVAYHVLTECYFLYDFEDRSTNYSTYSDIPLNVDGTGTDTKINKWKKNYDTIVNGNDTTFIDYILFKYDYSNVLTTSGVIHLIDQVMTQQSPSKANVTFSFGEEPIIQEYRNLGELTSYTIENPEILQTLEYSGVDLNFEMKGKDNTNALDGDYLFLDGDFTISYKVPKIVQGKYTLFLQANVFDAGNAVVEVYIDGSKLSTVDLTSTTLQALGSSNRPFVAIEIGDVDFLKYQSHLVTIKTLIPGKIYWDYVQFKPSTK